jgi:hypothetical protein
MKSINSYVINEARRFSESPIEYAKQLVYDRACETKPEFDYKQTMDALDEIEWADLMDDENMTNSQGRKMMDTVQKITADEAAFKKLIASFQKRSERERKKQEKENQVNAKKKQIAEEFFKDLIDNKIHIVIDNTMHHITIGDDGSIFLIKGRY